jgi:hypothetical protein
MELKSLARRVSERDLAILELKKAGHIDLFQKVFIEHQDLQLKTALWVQRGAKIFELSNGLISAFAETDLPNNLTPEMTHYPYDSFLIEGEKLFNYELTFSESSQEKYQMTSRQILVTLNPGFDHQRKNWYIAMDAIGEYPPEIRKDFSEMYRKSIGFDLPTYETLSVSVGLTERVYEERGLGFIDKLKFSKEILSEEQRLVCNLVFNAILYINDPMRPSDTEIRITKPIFGAKTDKKPKVNSERIFLGLPKTNITGNESEEHGKLNKRFTVRGHWRNQACGENMLEHRFIWIKPYWKGPNTAEILSKAYKVV